MKTETVIEPKQPVRASRLSQPARSGLESALHPVVSVFSSLRLTVVCLSLAVVLVFIGTLAQKNEGLYDAQHRYFRSLFIWWTPAEGKWRLPVFPGGYLIGGVLLINLLAAHAKRFQFTKKKIGIFIIHAGIVLMILGQFATDLLSTEGAMRIFEGETRNYSEAFHENELAIIDASDPQRDRVYSIPESMLVKHGEVRDARLPFVVRLKQHWDNADLLGSRAEGSVESGATAGALKDSFVLPRPHITDPEDRDLPAAVVEVAGDSGPVGTFLVYAGQRTIQRPGKGLRNRAAIYSVLLSVQPDLAQSDA
jgi:hypothetical protein